MSVATGLERRARGAAERIGPGLPEPHALGGESVQGRGVRMPVDAVERLGVRLDRLDADVVGEAIKRYELDPDVDDPRLR